MATPQHDQPFTPRNRQGERLTIWPSVIDRQRLLRGEGGEVMCVACGKTYRIRRRAACGLPGCRCDSIAVEVN